MSSHTQLLGIKIRNIYRYFMRHPVDTIGLCRWLAGRPKLRRERILGARYAASGRVSTSTRGTNHGREHRCVPARPAWRSGAKREVKTAKWRESGLSFATTGSHRPVFSHACRYRGSATAGRKYSITRFKQSAGSASRMKQGERERERKNVRATNNRAREKAK